MKYILLLLLLLFLPVVSIYAQRMVVEPGGNVYIESFGVRSDLIIPNVALKQQVLEDGTIRTVYHQGVSAFQNVLMSSKFRIAKIDAVPMSNQTFYVHNGLQDEMDGRPGSPMVARPIDGKGCDEYYELADKSDVGKWRVPTINEYVLMASFLTSYAVSIPGFTMPGIQRGEKKDFWYMSSTTVESDVNKAYTFLWYPSYNNVMTSNVISKSATMTRARCIMDIR